VFPKKIQAILIPNVSGFHGWSFSLPFKCNRIEKTLLNFCHANRRGRGRVKNKSNMGRGDFSFNSLLVYFGKHHAPILKKKLI